MKKKPLLVAIVLTLALAALFAGLNAKKDPKPVSPPIPEEAETPAPPELEAEPETETEPLAEAETEAGTESEAPAPLAQEEAPQPEVISEAPAMSEGEGEGESETAPQPAPEAEETSTEEAEAEGTETEESGDSPEEGMTSAESGAEPEIQEEEPEPPAVDPWDDVELDGEHYVTLKNIKSFYRFDELRTEGNAVLLEKANVRVKFINGQPDVWMNNIKFIFSFPLKRNAGRYLVHRIDLVKLLDPVMRPHFIENGGTLETIIIDPGHGGKDPGTVSPHGNGDEKEHALSLAKKLAKQLKKRGFKVALTRDDDTYLSLQQRVDFANEYENAAFVSLHFNAGGGGRAEGIETYTLSPRGVAGKEEKLKEEDFILKPGNTNDGSNIALATVIHSSVIKNTGRRDRGIRRARYSVLSGGKHPAILLEGGFLSSRNEGAYIARDDYQERIAFSIAEAIVKYKIATEPRDQP